MLVKISILLLYFSVVIFAEENTKEEIVEEIKKSEEEIHDLQKKIEDYQKKQWKIVQYNNQKRLELKRLESLREKKQADEALKKKSEGLEDSPMEEDHSSALSQYQQAHALWGKGEIDNAIKAFNFIVQKYPNTSFAMEALYHLGKIHFQKSNFSLAKEYFDKVLEGVQTKEESTAIESRLTLIECLYNLKNYEAVKEEAKKLDDVYLFEDQKKRLNQVMSQISSVSSPVKKELD